MSPTSTPPSDLASPDDPKNALPAEDAAAEAAPVAAADAAAPTEAAAEQAVPAAAGTPVAAAPRAPAAVPAEVAQKLKQLFPALFAGAPKPVKLRIQQDIQERAPGQFSKQDLSAFFRRHTRSTSYLHALSRARQRFDLDGQPAGEVSDEHRLGAAEELNQRRAGQDARRELEEQQRRNRAGLLRDFEITTLTRANFCVLKGVAVEELDGLLEIARQEALERPPERFFNDQRPQGRPGAERDRPPQGARRPDGGGGGGGGGGGPGPRDRGGRPPGDRGPASGPSAGPGPGPRRRSGTG